jgi:hypothetical protein
VSTLETTDGGGGGEIMNHSDPERPTGLIVRFPTASERPHRAPPGDAESRGTLLLFTGVRYERRSEPATPVLSGGSSRRRRSR